MSDLELLQRYVHEDDRQALATLVRRHTDWVYSAALRQVRDPHLAEDVTQAVFLALVQKAGRLSRGVVLPAWLLAVTRCSAAMARRSEARRRRHERCAAEMAQDADGPMTETQWQAIAPMLDELVEKLRAKDRQAILLRFYQRKSLAETAAEIGISEEAAKKRVARAVEKLRIMFRRRGIALSTALNAALLTNTTQGAPAGLAARALARQPRRQSLPHRSPLPKEQSL